MRLEWLEDILAVAETGSFSEAAERRHLTQSAFSRRVRSIEEQVGVELFDRTHKPVVLSPTTLRQKDQIADLAAGLRRLIEELRQGDRTSHNRVVLASQHSLSTVVTPTFIKHICGRDNDLFFRLRSANLDECFAMLLSRQADLAIIYKQPSHDHPVRGDFIRTLTIGYDTLIPVVAAANAVGIREGYAAGELPYISYPSNVFLGQVMGRMIWPRLLGELRPRARAETALTFAALEMAAAGMGVAWVPRSLVAKQLIDGKVSSLNDILPDCALEVTAVRITAGSHGKAVHWVWSQLTEMANAAVSGKPLFATE